MRLIRGLAALAALAALTAGIPAALVVLGGNPLPAKPSWAGVVEALLRRDDGTILVGLITVVAWVAWFVFALSLVAELVRVVSGFRVQIALPGLRGPQRLVAGLLLTVVAMLALPAASYAEPTSAAAAATEALPVPSTVAGSANQAAVRAQPAAPAPASAVISASAPSAAPTTTHRVQQGDDLWSLAEHYYGSGRDWRKIAAANPGLLTGGPDRLQIGWRLAIPDPDRARSGSTPSVVDVQPGDSLSRIAERVYGDQDKWREIFDANRAQIEDPDAIDVGAHLRVPGADGDASRPPHRARQGQQGRPATTRTAPRADRSAPGHAAGDAAGDAARDAESEGSADAPAQRQPVGPRVPRATTAPSAGPTTEHPPTTAPRPTTASATSAPSASPVASTATESRATAPPVPTSEPSVSGEHRPAGSDATADSALQGALGVGAVGGLLAASLLGGLAWRRRVQLHARPVGRRLPHPAPPAQAVETALGRRQTPLTPRNVDLATRAIAVHCQRAAVPVPSLALAKLAAEAVELVFHGAAPDAPVGFTVSGQSWHLAGADADYLASMPGIEIAPTPFPALTTLGRDVDDRQVVVDLEAVGLLALVGEDPSPAPAVLAAMATEIAFSPWAEELVLTLVGTSVGLPDVLGRPNVTQTAAVDDLLTRLEQRAATSRAHQPYRVLGQHRVDPDLADPWVPEIVLINRELTEEQGRRLVALTTSEPRVPLAAVVVGRLEAAPWVLELAGSAEATAAGTTAVLQPLGLELTPQLLPPEAGRAVIELVAVSGSTDTTPASWWSSEGDEAANPADENVTHLGKRFGGWNTGTDNSEETEAVAQQREGEPSLQVHHPILRLLGPVELVGATGTVPPRAGKQCLEYCGWLLEHPGTTAQAMASALVVAEGTRRSNMSRLRSWLGVDADGQAYLPDAYTGRILLHPSVSSDWQRLQILTAAGINKTSSPGLRAALELVRGAPLADAAPGQWHWAEELRTDMISAVRDAGVTLASRALADGDIDLARWAAARALVAAPGDELLMATRIRTEHQAGHVAETERLTLQLAHQARTLGVDLESETVMLLQQVLEGRVRARTA